ncbi:hypothetical protein BGY98DRAFT_954054 [Russula aff. rugulosa BPL654]|nr:hypothetical protein BGY98DRAFT_954054 [Russula aff. rugulosa BPL654]
MVLKILYAIGTAVLPSEHYYTHLAVAAVGIATVYAFAQGRKTSRERDLHGRTILITGAFTPNGLTLLNSLAQRGAYIIALTSEPPDTSPPATLVSLLRSTTSNENIYAEQCDLTSPASIRAFCNNYHKSEQRLDAVIFAHEYAPIGSIFSYKNCVMRDLSGCHAASPFAPDGTCERDIRLITLINPFYAAAARVFTTSPPSASSSPSLLLTEGRRALRTAILMRHLQRVLDALPSGAQVPPTDVNAQSIPVVSDKVHVQTSRADVVAPLLAADSSRGSVSWLGMIMYILLNPFLRVLTKSPSSASQSTLHALFLPTPFKYLSFAPDDPQKRAPEEVLKPGALYAECAVAPIHIPTTLAPSAEEKADGGGDGKTQGGGTKAPDDGELGGMSLGMEVWDDYERELKVWEAAEAVQEANASRSPVL